MYVGRNQTSSFYIIDLELPVNETEEIKLPVIDT